MRARARALTTTEGQLLHAGRPCYKPEIAVRFSCWPWSGTIVATSFALQQQALATCLLWCEASLPLRLHNPCL